MEVEPETELERRIVSDPDWREGAAWGKPRPGHPEGAVSAHIAEVLANVDRYARSERERRRLRLVALIHDTFKHRVHYHLPRVLGNDHAVLARRFAERHLDDEGVLDVIELHDEAYRAWRRGDERRALRLAERLGPELDLFRVFYRCDNETGDKRRDDIEWFEALLPGETGAMTDNSPEQEGPDQGITSPGAPTHEATAPPGNPPVDEDAAREAREKLEQPGAGH